MRWNALCMTLAAAVVTLTGCAQQVWLNKDVYDEFHQRNALPLGMEADPSLGVAPLTKERAGAPSNILDPERDPRYVTLAECIAIALENGTTGIQQSGAPGRVSDELLSVGPFPGQSYAYLQGDSIRVLALSPAITGTLIDSALARWDAVFVGGMNWSVADAPVQGFNSFNNGDRASFNATLAKPNAWGGVAGITFSTDYQNLNSPPRNFPILNPAYTPRLNLTYDQPLLQGAGPINQLLNQIPGTGFGSQLPGSAQSYLGNHAAGVGRNIEVPGLLLARIRFDQSRAEFERAVNFQLLNVEVAYWNLYGAYVNLFSAEQALRQAHVAWRINQAQLQAGKIGIAPFALVLGQYEQFRGDRLLALGRVLEAERQLRRLMGLALEDGKRLVPADAPTLAPYLPSWDTARDEALALRPELVQARAELKSLQMNLQVQENFLKPDLRFTSAYGVEGLGNRLDGNGSVFDASNGTFRSTNALRVLTSGHYDSWSMGLQLNIPLGFRGEHAAVRRAQMALAQGYLSVKNEEEKAVAFLGKTYRDISEKFAVIGTRRAQRQAFAEQLKARFQEFTAGKTNAAEFLVNAQQQWANALSSEYQAIVEYNNALATFQFAKGTLMHHNNVQVSEGPLPVCAQVRAVEHERERARAIVLRERGTLVPDCTPETGGDILPPLPEGVAPRLPAILEGAGPLPKIEEMPALPAPATMPTAPAAPAEEPTAVPSLTATPPRDSFSGATMGEPR